MLKSDKMKRRNEATVAGSGTTQESLRDNANWMASKRKRQALGFLLEELSTPEIDIPLISNYTSTMMTHMSQRNAMMIPLIMKAILKQSEPLVLEIRQRAPSPRSQVSDESPAPSVENADDGREDSFEHPDNLVPLIHHHERFPPGPDMQILPNEVIPILEEQEQSNEPERFSESGTTGANEKQFEIIFADSTRRADMDSEEHHMIIHSTTERTGSSSEEAGTVNVPNSFPLFQLVHAGEVPEEMQREIEQKIRQANPQLDLNSITFKFKSPETVEIIANVNT